MDHPRRPVAPTMALVGVLAFAPAGCAGDQSGAPAAAAPSRDQKIVVYSGRTESLVQPMLDMFRQKTSIAIEVRYGDTAQMAAQLLEEGDRSPAEVFLAQDAGALGAVAKSGLFAPLPPAVLAKVPPAFRARNGQWIGVTARARVLVYHVDRVPAVDLPTSVFDLTAPRWRGKVGIAPTNASFQAFITAMRVQHGDARTRQFLAGLKGNDPQIRENNATIVNDVNAGRITVGLVNQHYVYEKAAEDGTTVDALKVKLHFFRGGDTGALVNVSGVGVLSRAAVDPEVAEFLDYLLGTEAQTYFATVTFEYPVTAGVPAAPGLPTLDSLAAPDIDLNDLASLAATVAMLKDVGLA